MRVIVVSAANEGYFPLLRDMIESLSDVMGPHRPDLGIFDLGLTEDQKTWLSDQGADIKRPDWGFDAPSLTGMPETYKALTARSWLPDYFPHDLLLWIDADIWLQTDGAIRWALEGARGGKLAIAQELHPAYRRHYSLGEITGKYGWFAKYYGNGLANEIGLTPSLNVGLFALARDAVHWQSWRHFIAQALNIEAGPSVEQVALDYAVYANGLPTCWLPAHANWVCHQALPIWDDGVLVDPIAPHTPISALHLTLATKDRIETIVRRKDPVSPIQTGLRYGDLRAHLKKV